MTPKTIAVHGATGSQGAPVAALLTSQGHAVRPVTRAAGADLLDRGSLEAAYAGADVVVLQLPLIYDDRAMQMADNAARAAEAARVTHLVVNASAPLPPAPIGVPFVDARHHAAAADVPRVTVLQPTTYLENLSGPWSGTRVVADGVVEYPSPAGTPMYWVATADVAAAIGSAISAQAGGWFVLPGPAITGAGVARSLGDALGRPVRWEAIDPGDYADRMRPHVGDHAADGTAAYYRALASGPVPPAPDPAPAREALGWAPRDVAAWAREVVWPVPQPA